MNAVSIGVDVGTTTIKAVLIDAESEAVLACGRAATPWRQVVTGREMVPQELYEAVSLAVARTLAQTESRDVAGIGIASFGQSGTVVDASGATLVNFVSWDDSRFTALGAQLETDVGREHFAGLTGLAPAGCWSVNHVAGLSSTTRAVPGATWLGVADWVAFMLCGARSAEFSLASESGLLDVTSGVWAPDLVTWAGIDAEFMPPLAASGTRIGRVPRGPLVGAAVTIAGHDHAVGSFGAHATDPATLYDSAGTSETMVRRTVTVKPVPVELVLNHGLQVGQHVIAGQRVTTSQRSSWALGAVLEALDPHRPRRNGPIKRPAKVGGVMSGEPTWAKGASPSAVWQGAMEAVADDIAESARQLDLYCGPHERTVIAGGWSADPQFVDARARRLRVVNVSDVMEPGAVGAALAGAVAGQARPNTWLRSD